MIEKHLNRPLSKDEIVHHKDGDKMNNSIDNLELTNRSEHSRKHADTPIKFCVDCGTVLTDKRNKRCRSCYCKSTRKVLDRPDIDTLIDEVSKNGYDATGRKHGVSGNAVRKWIKVADHND